MANVTGFNHDLDKITERELVYDIYSRIKSGKDLKLKNEIYIENNTSFSSILENNGVEQLIFNKKSFIKDIDKKILSTIDTDIVNNFCYDNANTLKMAKIAIMLDTSASKRYKFKESYSNKYIYHTTNGNYIGDNGESVSSVIGDSNHLLQFNNDPKRIAILVHRDSASFSTSTVIRKAYFESNHIDITNILTTERLGNSNLHRISLYLDNIDFTNSDYLRIYYQ